MKRLCQFLVLMLVSLGLVSAAHGADRTRVLTSFDFENDEPFGLDLSPSFVHRIERSTITREGVCRPAEGRCPRFNGELDYERQTFGLNLDLAVGLYRDFQFRFHLPIVLSQQAELSFASGVDASNSSIAPAAALNPPRQALDGQRFPYRFFELPGGVFEGPTRAGLGDLRLALDYAPFSNARNPFVSTVVLSVEYMAPTGQPAKATNTGVGRGVHELAFRIAASRQVLFIDPYLSIGGVVPVAANNGLFTNYGATQRTVTPGIRAEISAGSEFILYEDDRSGQRYAIVAGVDFTYVARGRDYTPLFEGLAGSSCNGMTLARAGLPSYSGQSYPPSANPLDPGLAAADIACAWIVQQTANARGSDLNSATYFHDGITDVEGHALFGIHGGLSLQFAPLVRLEVLTQVATATPHLITGADAGRASTDNGSVNLDPAAGERNPYYNPTIDGVGSRFRRESVMDFSWGLRLNLQF